MTEREGERDREIEREGEREEGTEGGKDINQIFTILKAEHARHC